jgi:hypothetical protein
MSRRKGEMSTYQIDRGWPFQVALPALLTTGKRHDAVRAFCKDLSLCSRGHTFYRDGRPINVWCFAIESDAQKFLARFGGDMIDPKDRPRWPGKSRRR